MALIALSLAVVAAQSAPIKPPLIVKDQFSLHAAEVVAVAVAVAVAVERGLRGPILNIRACLARTPPATAKSRSLDHKPNNPRRPRACKSSKKTKTGRVAVCIPSIVLTDQYEDDIEGGYLGEGAQADYFAPGTAARPASSSRQPAWRNINPRASTAAASPSPLRRIDEGSISSRYGRPRLPTSMRVVPVIAQVPQQRSTSETLRGEWNEGAIQPPPMQHSISQAQSSTANSTPAQIPSREPKFTKDDALIIMRSRGK
ncbi:hypothetical protein BV22DRAFT_1049680 [Leucogyrophana mollusca]|uniref:Uncharacterized protein n=1 Tax=Leucogyrophana mollusca TaxID=85980 RepID=A0ACB8B7B6_9AGAM|nr:hypothetical protein BV22DRAFT_1049680 [Leucogyrophana mollusca]